MLQNALVCFIAVRIYKTIFEHAFQYQDDWNSHLPNVNTQQRPLTCRSAKKEYQHSPGSVTNGNVRVHPLFPNKWSISTSSFNFEMIFISKFRTTFQIRLRINFLAHSCPFNCSRLQTNGSRSGQFMRYETVFFGFSSFSRTNCTNLFSIHTTDWLADSNDNLLLLSMEFEHKELVHALNGNKNNNYQ